MDRREYLGRSTVVLSTLVGGCLSSETEPSAPEGMTVETEHWPKDILEKGLWYQHREREEPPSNYYTIITEKKAVGKKIVEDDDAVEEFTHKTDFDQSYLLVVQNMMQSARWLELQRINQRGESVEVDVVTESPDEDYVDDATVHSLLIRVTDPKGVPTELNVTIDSDPIDA
ncbi:hypothetical protein ACFQO4_19330 [Saliphagus sp. GCM10025334]|uniref:hypothetical protein n=1 Tax=Natronosalvus caseinilyticus TaxID=2953747 RepID=UPI0028AEC618|nr:hypothetical protein [Natronosalvus caseinilyticus]